MKAKREQALVGLFVLIASGLLIATVFALTGAFRGKDISYRTYLKNAGGISPGAEVRYNGGPPVGRVAKVHSDPNDPTRMEVEFHMHREVPVKTDSTVEITSFSPLGDNFLEVNAGKDPHAPRAQQNAVLQAKPYTSFNDVKDLMTDLGPRANELLDNLNQRVSELQTTLTRVNDLLSDANRQNVAEALGNVRGMLEEDRPVVHSALTRVNDASAKLGPLMDDFKKTTAQANDALAHMDAVIAENRPDLRQSIENLRQALTSASSLTDQLDRTLNSNAENIDEVLDNMRHISENLKEFTNTIKERPYTLIRASAPKPREPMESK